MVSFSHSVSIGVADSVFHAGGYREQFLCMAEMEERSMKIGFGCDHAAVELKDALLEHLKEQGSEVSPASREALAWLNR